jgi:hypothetical protein
MDHVHHNCNRRNFGASLGAVDAYLDGRAFGIRKCHRPGVLRLEPRHREQHGAGRSDRGCGVAVDGQVQ